MDARRAACPLRRPCASSGAALRARRGRSTLLLSPPFSPSGLFRGGGRGQLGLAALFRDDSARAGPRARAHRRAGRRGRRDGRHVAGRQREPLRVPQGRYHGRPDRGTTVVVRSRQSFFPFVTCGGAYVCADAAPTDATAPNTTSRVTAAGCTDACRRAPPVANGCDRSISNLSSHRRRLHRCLSSRAAYRSVGPSVCLSSRPRRCSSRRSRPRTPSRKGGRSARGSARPAGSTAACSRGPPARTATSSSCATRTARSTR